MKPNCLTRCLALVGLVALSSVTTHAQNGTWANLAGGSWATAANWSGSIIATNTGNTANFSTLTLASSPTVTVDGARTIGNLTFGDVGNTYGWLLGPGSGGTLTLGVSSGSPLLTVNGQTNTIGAVLGGTAGFTKAGAGVLNLTNINTLSGTVYVNAGTLILANPGGGGGGTIGSAAIVVTNGSTLVLNNGDVLGYSSTQPLTVSGTVLKIYNQDETLNRPITLIGATFTNTLATNVGAYELYGGYIATAAGTTNYISGPGQFGLRSSNVYFTNAPGSYLTFSDCIFPYSGGAPLNKYGAGTMIFSGTNTYSGNTFIGGGTLALTGTASMTNSPVILVASNALFDVSALASPYVIPANQTLLAGSPATQGAVTNVNGSLTSGGTINIGGSGTNATLTVNGNLSLTGGTLVYDLGATSDAIALAGASPSLSLSGTTAIQPTTALTPGTYTLISNAATVGAGSSANLALAGGVPRGETASFTVAAPSVTLTVTGGSSPGSVTWQGTNGSAWDTTTVNWVDSGTSTSDLFYPLDYVTFDDTGRSPALLTGPTFPASVTVQSAYTNYNFGGPGSIAGTASLTMSGGSILTISNNNSYTGGTTISGGIVRIANASGSALGSGPLTLTGGVLDLYSNNLTVGTFSGYSSLITDSNCVTASTNGTTTRNLTDMLTVNEATSNSFTGLINNGIYANSNIWISNSVPVTNRVSNTAVIGLTKNGPGYLLLAGASTFSGGATVNAGTLEITNKSLNDTAYTVAQGATLKLGYSTITTSYSPAITVNGTGTGNAAGLYLLGGKSFNVNGTLTLQNQPTTVQSYGSGNATIYGFDVNGTHLSVPAAGSGSILSPTVTVSCNGYGFRLSTTSGTNNANGDLLIGGVITGSAANGNGGPYSSNFRKEGTGSVLLTNASTYARAMIINGGSVILAGGANRLPAGSGLIIAGGATLQLNGVSQTLTNLTAVSPTSAGAVVGNSIVTSTLTITNSLLDTNWCAVGGTGVNQNNLALVKQGSAQLVMFGPLTYTNNTTVSAGQLIVGALTNADNATLTVVDAAGSLQATNLALGVSSGSIVAVTGLASGVTAPIVATNLTTAGTVYISAAGNLQTGVQYPIIKYTSGTIGGAGFNAFKLLRGLSGSVVNNTANNSVDIILTSTNFYPLVWTGNINTNWDINTTSNWAFNGVGNVFLNNDIVQLDDTATPGSTNINLTTTVLPASLTVANNTLSYSLNGPGAISGNIGITKNGTGSITLNNTNTFTGVTTVNAGTVNIANIANGGVACALGQAGNSPANVVLNGGGLSYTGPTASSDRGLTFTTNNGAIGVSVTGNLTLNGPANSLVGPGAMVYNGPGTLTLSSLNIYTNGTTVNGGKLVSTVWEWYGRRGIGYGLLTINSNALAEFTQVHGFGTDIGGRAATINGGTLQLDNGNYVSGFTFTGGNVVGSGITIGGSGMTVTANPAATTAVISNSIAANSYSGTLNLAVSNGTAPVGLAIYGNLTDSGGSTKINLSGAGTTLFAGTNTYSGATYISGGNLVLSNSAFSTSSTSFTLTNGATLNLAGLNSPAVLSGSQTLQGVGTVVGPLTDSGGTTIIPGSIATPGTLTINSNLTLTGSENLDFALGKIPTSAGGTNNSRINVNGNLTINSGTVVNINAIQVALAGGTYKLITYTGTLIDNSGGIATGWTIQGYTPAGRVTGVALSTATPGEIDLVVTGSPASLTWKGDGANQYWDIQTTANWLNGGSADEYYQLDNVLFTDLGSNNPAINLQANVTPSSVVFSNSAKNYTLTTTTGAGISGGTGLTKNGTGTITLLNNNPYTGVTTINAGTLVLGDGSSNDGSLSDSPIVDNSLLDYNVAYNQTAATNISGSGTVEVTGSQYGTLTLAASNSWSGPLNILNGTAKPSVNFALPAGCQVTVANNAQFDFNGVNNAATTTRGYSFTIAGAGTDGNSGALINSSVTSIASYASVSNLTLTANSTIGGTGRWDVGPSSNSIVNGGGHILTKAGSCPLSFRPNYMTNLAGINITAGDMWYESYSETNPWTATTTNTISSGAFLGIYGGQTINVPIVCNGGTINNAGAGTEFWTGSVDLEQFSQIDTTGGSIVFFGPIVANANNPGNTPNISLLGGNTVAFATSEPISWTQMNWVTNTTIQIGYNTASGALPDTEVTIPTPGSSYSIYRSDLYTLTNTVDGYGNFQVIGTNAVVVDGSGSINIGGNIYIGQGMFGQLNIHPGANIQSSGFLMGNPNAAGGAAVTQTGGSVIVTNPGVNFRIGHWATETSTYTMYGGSLASAASLCVGYDGTGILLQTNGSITLGTGATLYVPYRSGAGTYTLNGGSITINSGGISVGAGSVNLGGGTVYSATSWSSSAPLSLTGINGNVTIDTGTNLVTLSGNLSGTGGFNKVSTGQLVLSGATTFTGTGAVNGGTLLLSGSTALGSTLSVGASGTLTGMGVAKGAVVNSGTFAPGTNGIGAMTISNTLTLNSGGTTTLSINRAAGTNSYGSVKGLTSVNYGGTLTVTSTGGTFVSGDSFTLFSGATSSTGNFSTLNLPTLPSGLVWTFTPATGVLSVGPSTPPPFSGTIQFSGAPVLTGTTLSISANYTGSGSVYLLTGTNLNVPISAWTPIWTNTLSGTGSFTTNLNGAVNLTYPEQYYIFCSTNW